MEMKAKSLIEIKSLDSENLKIYHCCSEVQLLRYHEPQPGIFIAESPKVIGRALDAGYEPISMLVDKKVIDRQAREIIGRCRDIPVYVADESVLTKIAGFPMTQGALCAMRRRPLPDVDEVCRDAKRIAVLEEITNQTNVGAIFRSAAALDFDAVLLTKGCSDPLYRRSVRVSMGTVFQIPWTFFDDVSSNNVRRLQDMGFVAAAMTLRDDSVRIDHPALASESKLAVILGNEGDGLREETIAACDYKVRIPMAHGVDSLNVAAASAVTFWQLRRR